MTEFDILHDFFNESTLGFAATDKSGKVELINPLMQKMMEEIDVHFSSHNNIIKTLAGYDRALYEKCTTVPVDSSHTIVDNYILEIPGGRIKKLKVKISSSRNETLLFMFDNLSGIAEIEVKNHTLRLEITKLQDKITKIGLILKRAIHDVKNPISNISSISEMIDLAPVEDAKKLMKINMKKVSEDITAIINDLHDYMSPEITKFEPVHSAVLGFHIKNRNEVVSKKFGVKINFSCPCDFDLRCDEERILKVFSTIAVNMSKALIHTKTPDPEINVSITPEGDHILIALSDNCTNIPPEHLDSLFDPAGRKSHYTGTGIGLPVVKNSIELHNGSIQVSSGKTGTSFNITLPLDPDAK